METGELPDDPAPQGADPVAHALADIEAANDDELDEEDEDPTATAAEAEQRQQAAAAAAAAAAADEADRDADSLLASEDNCIALMRVIILSMCEYWVLRASPLPMRTKLTRRQCIERFTSKFDLGELDEYVAHIMRLPDIERDAAVSGETHVLPALPVKPGEKLPPELERLVTPVAAHQNPPAPTPRADTGVQFKPSVPQPETFKGTKPGDDTKAVCDITAWISAVQSICSLLNLTQARGVEYAVRFLRGDAQNWWLGWNARLSCVTFSQLRAGLTDRFVSTNPFEILCAELKRKNLEHFTTYDAFKAWLVQTVTAMKSYAEPGRMWPDTVLIDQLLLALRGTLYHETVVLDPETRTRPTTFEHALKLMDDRHRVLQARQQAHGPKSPEKSSEETWKTVAMRGREGKRKEKADGKRKMRSDSAPRRDSDAPESSNGARKRAGRTAPAEERLPLDQYLAKKFGVTEALAKTRREAGKCAGCDKKHDYRQACPGSKGSKN
jgi:hypothetical protein